MPLKFTVEDTPFEHLYPDVAHLATADRATRRAAILTDRWIGYPAADDAIERMFEQIDTPPRLRMASILFWAPPNSGKTHILTRFLELHANRQGQEDTGVLSLEVNDGLNEKRFYIDLLTALGAPAPDTTASRLQAMVIRQLRARRVRLLILDEIQRITELRARDQRLILNVLKYLSNQLSMSIAGFGSGEAKALIESDQHLEERFDIVALLPHGASPIKIADDVTLHGDTVDPVEPRDVVLVVADFDPASTIRRAWRVLASDTGEKRLEHRLRLRLAVRDVVDALAASRREPNGGSMVSLFERPMFNRKSLRDPTSCCSTGGVTSTPQRVFCTHALRS